MKKNMLILFLIISPYLFGQEVDEAGMGNPLLPGYFADPTIKKFGDTYYIYSTTDGIKLASGEPQVWISKDFVNWYNFEMEMELPDGLTNCWAPDVLEGKDGKYYYFMGNCQFGCNIYGYVSSSPMGPWMPINEGRPVIPVGTGKEKLPALDAQFFLDDDETLYSYFGTWCTTFGGLGWGKFEYGNNFTLEKEGFIPIEQLPEAFEAAYMLKKDSIYFLMYSSGDCRLGSYAVQYAWSRDPLGPFYYGDNNPILQTNNDNTIHGPGHHSVLKEGDEYYILYHRHDNPHSTGGEFRQVCADKMTFVDAHTISKIIPTHKGVGYMGENQIPFQDIMFKAKISATSFYHLISEGSRYTSGAVDHKFLPEYAVDDNNGTVWKAGNGSLPQSLVIDLGVEKLIKRVLTQFEYPTFYYQYKIEISSDSLNWKMFSDRTENRISGSPMIDDNSLKGRYIKLTVTGTEKSGMYAAVWNIKAYSETYDIPSYQNKEIEQKPGSLSTNSLLVDLNIEGKTLGVIQKNIKNKGTLEGEFINVGAPLIKEIDQVKAIYFDGESHLKLSEKAPESLGWNSAYTACAWVYNPDVGNGECLLAWNSRENMLQSSYAAFMYGNGHYGAVAHGDGAVDIAFKNVPTEGEWHFLAVTFDGMQECIYVDGKLDRQIPLNLFVKNDRILIGTSGEKHENFTGYIARIQLYDNYFSEDEIRTLMEESIPKGVLIKNSTK